MALYMLDTDISSYIIKKKPIAVLNRFEQLHMEQICISVITYAELLYGVKRTNAKKVNQATIDSFVLHLSVLDWSSEAAHLYAEMRTNLEKKGTPVGNMDLLIVAHAQSLGAIMVTNNAKHFERIPNLRWETWV